MRSREILAKFTGLNYAILASLILMLFSAAALAVSSPGGEFSVTPNSQLVNWTNSTGQGYFTANLTLTNNNATRNITLDILNLTSLVINSLGTAAPFSVSQSNSTLVLNGSSTAITLFFNTVGLAAGRYSGTVNISNSTNATESVAVNITLDVPLNTNSSGFGSVSGSVTNTTFVPVFLNASSAVTHGLRINLTAATGLPVNLDIYNGAGTLVKSASFWASNSTQIDYTSQQSGYWKLNFTSNASASFNASVELLEASLLGNNAAGVLGLANKTNRGYNATFTLLFWLNNSADYGVNLTSITSSGTLNLTGDSTKRMEISSYNITLSNNLSANSATLAGVNITVNTLNTSNTEGNYFGWLTFATDRGYPNATLNVTFTVNLTGELQVSDIAAANQTGGSYGIPGGRINVTVAPKWQNGTTIPNLMINNFAVWLSHKNSSLLTNSTLRNISLTVNNATWNNSHYIINASIPSYAIGGNFTVFAQAGENNSLNGGASSANGTILVNETALKISVHNDNDVDISETSISLTGGTTAKFYVNVSNFGAATAQNVTITRSGLSSSTCGTITAGAGTNIGLGNIGPGGSNKTYTTDKSAQVWTFTAANTTAICYLSFNGSSSGGAWDRSNTTLTLSVTGGGGGGGGGDQPGGQQPSSNETSTPSYGLEIMEWEKQITLEQGSSRAYNVRIRNTGTSELGDVVASVGGIASGWWSSSDKKSLPRGTFSDWTVKLMIPADAEIKNYSITFTASNSKTTSPAKDGTLVVTPGPAAQEQIKTNITEVSVALQNLRKEINRLAAQGRNVSLSNSTLVSAFELLDSANSSAAANSWLAAYNYLRAAAAKLSDVEVGMNETTIATGGIVFPSFALPAGSLLNVIAALALAGAGTLGWMFHSGRLRRGAGAHRPKAEHPHRRVAQETDRLHPLKHVARKIGHLIERLGRKMEKTDKRHAAHHWRPK